MPERYLCILEIFQWRIFHRFNFHMYKILSMTQNINKLVALSLF